MQCKLLAVNFTLRREITVRKRIQYLSGTTVDMISGSTSRYCLCVCHAVTFPLLTSLRFLIAVFLRNQVFGEVTQFQVDCVWNVMAHAHKPDFVFRRNGRVHLNRRGRQFIRLLAAEVCASASSNVRYTMFRGSVKSTDYPLHSPVYPSLPHPCVTVCHHVSIGLYYTKNPWMFDPWRLRQNFLPKRRKRNKQRQDHKSAALPWNWIGLRNWTQPEHKKGRSCTSTR
jgi:hypothetical protein